VAFEEVRARTEIETLHGLLDEIDYYRLLLVPRTAPLHEIETAFRAQTKALHPDHFFALEQADLKAKAQEIFRRVNEAWRTLKDPALREAYDRELKTNGGVRMSAAQRELAERAKRQKHDVSEVARTPNGKRHWALALSDLAAKNLKGAVLNGEIALKYEGNNRAIAKWIAKVRAMAQAQAST
jgi:curved DNA-binding protein CbpA